jgi:hypothetical protein
MPLGRRFEPGNPGRPKGSRHKLGEAFISALHDDFVAHGQETIEIVRQKDPSAYLKVCASLLPKEFKITDERDLTNEQILDRIRQLDDAIRPLVNVAAGAAGLGEGTEAPYRH